MSQDFIQAEAQKHLEVTNEAKSFLAQGLLNSTQDTNSLGNLIGATAGTVASLGKLIPGSKLLLAFTTANGALLNYGITVAKDGANSYKAIVTSTSGAIVSTVVSESLGFLAGRVFAAAGLVVLGTVGAPVALTVVAGTVIIGASYYAGNLASTVAGEAFDYFFGKEEKIETINNQTTISTTNSLQIFLDNDSSLLTTLGANSNDNWDIHATIPSVSNPEAFAEQLKYDSGSKTATIETNDQTTELQATTTIVTKTQANTLTLNNQTLDIVTPTNLQLRNALESIADYQFLLSDVLIKPDEMLDMGAAGVVTVSSGDTLSQLAVKYLGGNAVDATRNAVLLNPWLADEGRINFIANTNKILMKAGASIEDTNVDHVYKNEESAEDLALSGLKGADFIHSGSSNDNIERNGGLDTKNILNKSLFNELVTQIIYNMEQTNNVFICGDNNSHVEQVKEVV